jgi:hypothetical protein
MGILHGIVYLPLKFQPDPSSGRPSTEVARKAAKVVTVLTGTPSQKGHIATSIHCATLKSVSILSQALLSRVASSKSLARTVSRR